MSRFILYEYLQTEVVWDKKHGLNAGEMAVWGTSASQATS